MLKVFETFSGIGSQTQALKNLNIKHEVIGISEIDKYAIKVYETLHGKVNNFGDITKIDKLPYCDLLTYSFPCFVKDTLILTDKGYRKIQDIKIRDRVLTHKNTYEYVLKTFENKTNKIINIKCSASDNISTTENHPFYVRKLYRKWNDKKRVYERLFNNPEWVQAKDLDKNCYLGIAINKNSKLPEWDGCLFRWGDGRRPRLSNKLKKDFDKKEFWWTIGRYIGDGWIRSQGGIIICCKQKEIKTITDNLDVLKYNYNIIKEKTIYKIHIPFKEISEYLLRFGKGAKNKHLIKDIFDLPVVLLKSFINGYQSADGCFTLNRNKITSISKELIYGIGECILKAFNNPYSVYKTIRNKKCIIQGRVVNQNNTYEITWHEKRKQDKSFYEQGYCWSPVKKKELINKTEIVYNFEVERCNSYTVNNIIVHNCQDLSIAGKQSGIKQGNRSGLLIEVERLIEEMEVKPKYLLLENVKNLISDKFYPDYEKWLNNLSKFGYVNYSILLNSKDYGIPQNRERVFCVSIRKDIDKIFWFPEKIKLNIKLSDMLETNVDNKYYISDMVKKSIIKRMKYNSFDNNIMQCQTARQYSSWTGHYIIEHNKIRRMTPKECFRLMGFKDEQFNKIAGISDNQLYKMAGNSIVVNVLEAIFKNIFL
jgi:site-specific DNA-cytosine methylase